jgi:hypothetical protein
MAHAFSAAASAEFTAEEMDFIAQHQMVQIVPLFELGRLHFIGRGFGPFRARQPIDVPLWLAAELKKDGRCDMIAPPWLSVEGLEAVISSEKSDKLMLSTVHPHYQEVAASILRHDPACVAEADRVRSLLKDLEQLREAKILQSMKGMADRDRYSNLAFANFSLMEVSVAACCSHGIRLTSSFTPTVQCHPLHYASSCQPYGGSNPLTSSSIAICKLCLQELDVDAMAAQAAGDDINRDI